MSARKQLNHERQWKALTARLLEYALNAEVDPAKQPPTGEMIRRLRYHGLGLG